MADGGGLDRNFTAAPGCLDAGLRCCLLVADQARLPQPDEGAGCADRLLDCNAVIRQRGGMAEAATNFHGFLTMQSRGVIALPPELRRRYQLDRPGAQVEITERSDGVLEIRPTVAIPANQAWFWTDAWQKREREADADIAAGRVTSYDDVDALLDDLPS